MSKVRADIQALRAIAVLGVVVNHTRLHGQRLPGGYAGVDVFFVISGFLITSHLIKTPPRGLRDLGAFWARRIRRLLPAALAVLLATLALSRLLAISTAWADTARMARAATLYCVNWLLARDATDYFRSNNATTPIQHYWSLSVEEQFYVVWPVLMLAAHWVSRRVGPMLASLVVLWIASFAASIYLTSTDSAAAYFVTWTRGWELATGAILATAASRRRGPIGTPLVRTALALTGLAAIAITFAGYDDHTPFPGHAALLPVLGTALVIAAQVEHGALGRTLAFAPVQWIGDISYSLYLWHWPIWMLLPPLLARNHLGPVGIRLKLLAIALGIAAAAASKYLIEDPARYWRPQLKLRALLPVTVLAMAVVVIAANLQLAEVRERFEAAHAQLLARQSDPCLGAAWSPAHCAPSSFDHLVLHPAEVVGNDIAVSNECQSPRTTFEPKTCIKGDPHGAPIAIVGNSHMDQWRDAFDAIGAAEDFKVITHVASGCVIGMPELFLEEEYRSGCERWGSDVIAALQKERPRVVVISNRQAVSAAEGTLPIPKETAVARARSVLRQIQDLELPIIILKDPPYPDQSVPQCLESKAPDLHACTATIHDDYYAIAAEQLDSPRIKVISLDDYFGCNGTATCATVVGNVMAYQDGSHLTMTMVRSLTPYLDQALAATGLMPGQ